MTDFLRARRAMVDNQLRTSGITDRRILAAMGELPREAFVPEARRGLAYVDVSHVLPGPTGRSLAAPAAFARLLQLADVRTGDRVLDVGAGTGYSAAVLGRLAREVVGVEDDADLVAEARETLARLGVDNVRIEQAPMEAGAPAQGPYDVIVLEGAVPDVFEALLNQLAEGGRLAAIVQTNAAPAAHLYVRSGNEFAARPAFNLGLPPLSREPRARAFAF